MTKPRNGETTPRNGETTPRNGEATPRNGETTSHNGKTTSHNDKTTSHNGETTTHNDKTTSRNGETPSYNDETTPGNCETTSHIMTKPHHIMVKTTSCNNEWPHKKVMAFHSYCDNIHGVAVLLSHVCTPNHPLHDPLGTFHRPSACLFHASLLSPCLIWTAHKHWL